VASLAVLFVAALTGLLGLYFNRIEPREIRVQINTPSTQDPVSFAISPDGQRIAFVANNDGKPQLWIRPLDSLVAQPLPGTDGATYPFWSPDSRAVGFFASGRLKRMDIAGGGPQTLANATPGLGGSWSQNGVILFVGTVGGPLRKVAASGGEAEPVTADTNPVIHRFPQFLPDGNHFIFTSLSAKPGIYLSSLDGLQPKLLVNGDTAASITPSGFLFFLRQGTLFAQSFDFKKLQVIKEPTPIAEQVITDQVNASAFSAAPGIIAYRPGGSAASRQLTWFDRTGKPLGVVGEIDLDGLNTVDLSPDGKHVAVMRSPNSNTDIWLLDTARGIPTRFTFDAAIDAQPVWAPDGSRVVFSSNRKGIFNLYSKLATNVGTEDLLLTTDQVLTANDVSPDGRFLLFRRADPNNGYDLWVLPMFGEKKPVPFRATPFDERDGQFSPDGRWVAYQSNESGRFEIYVQPFPGPGEKIQVSTGGGAQVRWRRNGKEIFFISLDGKLMAASVKLMPSNGSIEIGTPQLLFMTRVAGGALPGLFRQQYSVSNDGQRFLMNATSEGAAVAPINVIYNWKPKGIQ
jgi:Tol biopolymer transport system component